MLTNEPCKSLWSVNVSNCISEGQNTFIFCFMLLEETALRKLDLCLLSVSNKVLVSRS